MRVPSASRRRAAWCVVGTLLGAPAWALAQARPPAPPGPYVIDVRGATMGLPDDAPFYPPLPADTLVPSRGFGVEVGGHVFTGRLGPAHLGAGASFAYIRGTTTDTAATVRVLAPQLSFNFGTTNGWSYLSAGIGTGDVQGRFTSAPDGATVSQRSGAVLAMNVGGGARWFVTRHLAVGFDLRLHHLGSGGGQDGAAGTPSTMVVLASAGLSVK